MKDLVYELKALCQRNRDGSYSTQADRWAMLRQMGEQLLAAGYNQLHVYELKGRHLNTLLKQWQTDGLSVATQKNRMAVLRWWAEKIGKGDMFQRTNTVYGIGPRQTIPAVSKARTLPGEKLSRVSSPYVRMSLELQRAFGLRREEAMKIQPHQADQGTVLVLQGSWCKGGAWAQYSDPHPSAAEGAGPREDAGAFQRGESDSQRTDVQDAGGCL